MSKIDKKRKRIVERINEMEEDMRIALTKKSSSTVEINLPLQQKRIAELKKKLAELK